MENSGPLSTFILDALIVAAARVASCSYLLTEDLQAGQQLDGIEIISPFSRDPESVL
jgi:predicted nucleic acid-binding protein